MITECDNTEYFKWIEMSEPIFENMNIDISKIPIYMSMECNIYLPNSDGRASQMLCGDDFFIQIRNDLQFDRFIQTYAHEVGHATQKLGYFKNSIAGVIAESIALKFEKEFLKKFNKKYDTNISVNTVFKGIKYRIASYAKNLPLLPLITKPEYKLKK